MLLTEIVWSPIKDTSKKDIKKSPIWKQCYKDEEMTKEITSITETWYRYEVKFDGLVPVQVTKISTERIK